LGGQGGRKEMLHADKHANREGIIPKLKEKERTFRWEKGENA